MTAAGPGSDPDIERQRARLEAAFRGRWPPPDAGKPRVLEADAYAEGLQAARRGGRTSLDPVALRAVRDGARPGDPLPPRQPGHYTSHVTGTDVIVSAGGGRQWVVVLFSHEHFPGVRFGHRLHPGGGAAGYFALMHDIETGHLHRAMEAGLTADPGGITWTPWGARIPGLEQQRAEIEAAFRDGWRPAGAGQPRTLTEQAYAEARRILGRGGWSGLDQETIQAVRGGAQPGDPLPPLAGRPFILGVTEAEVVITGSGDGRRVAVLFLHEDFPGARFGHRFPLEPGAEGHEQIWLMEEIETGALHRMMQSPPPADSAGIIWTTWGDSRQD